MRKHFVLMILFVIVGAIGIAQTPPQPLKIYFIDVEGGQANLFVSPAGQSMLVDAGWPIDTLHQVQQDLRAGPEESQPGGAAPGQADSAGAPARAAGQACVRGGRDGCGPYGAVG